MAFVLFNPNPLRKNVDDCTVRAICAALGIDWEKAYMELAMQGLMMADMPNSNSVWGSYLKSQGFTRRFLQDTCPECYTVRDFCMDNPQGVYVLGTGTHAVASINGDYIDSWDSGDKVPSYFWKKEGV